MKRNSKRYYNDKGEVGYVVSPDYGAGWYAHNGSKYPECATDPTLVKMVLVAEEYVKSYYQTLKYSQRHSWDYGDDEFLKEQHTRIIAYAKKKWPDGYWSAHSLHVQFAPEGYVVKFEEYDGSESAYAYPPDNTLLSL